jgi:DNA-binding MarR family transcriptional regulator
MTSTERIQLEAFVGLLHNLCETNPDFTIKQLVTFVVVSLHPGQTVTDLAKTTNATLAAASRHTFALGANAVQGKSLFASGYSGRDGRKKSVLLTEHGKKSIGALLRLLAVAQNDEVDASPRQRTSSVPRKTSQRLPVPGALTGTEMPSHGDAPAPFDSNSQGVQKCS